MSTIDPKTKKEELRQRLRKGLKRGSLTATGNDRVCEAIARDPAFRAAKYVGIFAPRKWEVDLTPLWKLRPDACVFPRVTSETEMTFYRVLSLQALTPGFAGIAEPPADPVLEVKAWSPTDLVLVPGLAFDLWGGRLGSGKGFYDRFLATVPAARWGVCWQAQLLNETLAQEPTDVRMGALCTESGVKRILSNQP